MPPAIENSPDPNQLAASEWADTAYRSAANETFMEKKWLHQPYPSQEAHG
jgi:hypothetical protein